MRGNKNIVYVIWNHPQQRMNEWRSEWSDGHAANQPKEGELLPEMQHDVLLRNLFLYVVYDQYIEDEKTRQQLINWSIPH